MLTEEACKTAAQGTVSNTKRLQFPHLRGVHFTMGRLGMNAREDTARQMVPRFDRLYTRVAHSHKTFGSLATSESLVQQGQRGRATTRVACVRTLSKTGAVCWNTMPQLLCTGSTSNSANYKTKSKLCKSNQQGRHLGRYSYTAASWPASNAPQNSYGGPVTGTAISHRFVQPQCLHRKGPAPPPQQLKKPKNMGAEGRSPPSPPCSA